MPRMIPRARPLAPPRSAGGSGRWVIAALALGFYAAAPSSDS